MSINLHIPSHTETLRPKITVIGVGGAGGNAVNNMIAANLEGVDFCMANTDAQALENSMTDRTIQMGATTTQGLGAGASPNVGRAAAEEALEEIAGHTEGSNMVFITAGMGGGTGTGAAPVIAQLSREQGILTVGVVTKPFHFEGTHRMKMAEEGIKQLQQYVDTLIVIPNQNLFRVANEKTTFADAFRMADEVLHSGVRGVTDLIVKPGLVNLDFADIRAVMSEMGKAMMGTGEAEGDKRAIDAAESAISNPLLDDVSLKGATGVLINITGGPDMTLFEVDEAANRIRDEVDNDANIIFGSTFSDQMEGKMRVSVVATGIDHSQQTSVTPMVSSNVKKKDSEPVTRRASSSSEAVANVAARRAEPKRERSAAEIVRDSGTASINDIAKQVRATRKKEMMPEEPINDSPLLIDDEPVQLSIEDYDPDIQEEKEVKESGSRRRPLKLGELKGQLDAPLFVSPKAEQPAARTLVDSDDMHEDEDDTPLSESSGLSFFQKIAGVKKSLSSGMSSNAAVEYEDDYDDVVMEEDDEPVRKAKVREKVSVDAEEDGDDYLDIPAFLRRQAN